MGNLIINADDFGLSRAVNYGIIDCYKHGILTSTTMMANMPAVDHAISLAKANPKLAIGVHLTLTAGNPILNVINSLTDQEGHFHSKEYYQTNSIDLEELYAEWDAQIQFLLSEGLVLSHIDSHHHAHGMNNHNQVVTKLAIKYNLPVRPLSNVNVMTVIDSFSVELDELAKELTNFNLSAKEIEVFLIKEFEKGETVEFMVHPGYIDQELLDLSSYTLMRATVAKFLIESSFSKYLQTHDEYNLINYFHCKQK